MGGTLIHSKENFPYGGYLLFVTCVCCLIPYCLFTDPQLARVGLRETEARQRGMAVRLGRLPRSAVLRAQTTGDTRGFMKVLIDARSDRILGFTMFGPEAGEVMPVVQTAMLAGMPYTGLRDAILRAPHDGGRPGLALCAGPGVTKANAFRDHLAGIDRLALPQSTDAHYIRNGKNTSGSISRQC